MTKVNPFIIDFGEEPHLLIERNEFDEITSTLNSDISEARAIAIIGPCGTGKTVLLSKIKKQFACEEEWITVDLNPFSDMLEQLAAKIYEQGRLKKLFLNDDFNFSFSGLSLKISGDNPLGNVNSLLGVMFKYLKKNKKKVLITVDDIASSNIVKSFVYSFQSFLREGYDVFFILTGLYENISKLENTNGLTFLLRTKKVMLEALNMRSICSSYQDIFNISEKDALILAKATNGYAYAYQLLGNILFKNNEKKLTKKILSDYDQALENNVYLKIWESLLSVEQKIMFAMVNSADVKDILIETGLNNSKFQVYKKRLFNQGLINIKMRGKITFVLPRFKEFVAFQKLLIEE